ADTVAMHEEALEAPLDDSNLDAIGKTLARLEAKARDALASQGFAPSHVRALKRVHLRYDGTDSALPVEFGSTQEMVSRFEAAYRKRYGFLMSDRGLIAESASVEGIGAPEAPREDAPPAARGGGTVEPADWTEMHSGGRAHRAPVFLRDQLAAGDG